MCNHINSEIKFRKCFEGIEPVLYCNDCKTFLYEYSPKYAHTFFTHGSIHNLGQFLLDGTEKEKKEKTLSLTFGLKGILDHYTSCDCGYDENYKFIFGSFINEFELLEYYFLRNIRPEIDPKDIKNHSELFPGRILSRLRTNNNHWTATFRMKYNIHATTDQATDIVFLWDIEKILANVQLSTLFSEPDNTIQHIVETFSSRNYSKTIWTTFLNPLSTEQLILGVRKVFKIFQTTKNNSLKPLIQTLYSLLANRKSSSGELLDIEIRDLTDWILSNTDETDLPFSSTNYSAKSTQEYLFRFNIDREIKYSLNCEQSKLETDKMNLNNQRQTLFNELTAIQNQINETAEILASKEKKIERFKELLSFTELNSLSRLRKIINSDRPVFYFPDILFKDTINFLEQLDQTEKQILRTKLKTAKKGILKELKIKLDTLGQ